MRVADTCNVFGRTTEFHDSHGFSDKFGSRWPNDVHTQNFVGAGISQDFDKAGGIAQRTGTAIGHEGEGTGIVFATFRLQLLLGLSNPSHFGRGVDDRRDQVVIDVTVLASNDFSYRHAFSFGFVRQHGATYHVAHRPYVGQVGFAVIVDHNETALVGFEANGFHTQTFHVGHPADRHNQPINLKRLLGPCAIGVGYGDTFLTHFDLAGFYASVDGKTLLGQSLLGFFGHLLVDHREEVRQGFEHGDLRTQTAPYAGHFKANSTGANNAQLGGYFGNAQGPVIGQHTLFVEGQLGERPR